MPFRRVASDLILSVITSFLILVCLAATGAQSSTFKTIYAFHSPERYPQGGLTLATDGKFYGTTAYGGPHDSGTVFRMTSAGQITELVAFEGSNGASPQAALIPGPDGNFYGTTSAGGASGNGTIFRVTSSGILTSLYSFTGGTDGSSPRSALVVGTDGNLYGTTNSGGASGVGTAFRITPSGSFTLLYAFQNFNGMPSNPNGLALGSDGNFYGTTYWGGSSGYGTVFQMTRAGSVTVLYSFTAGSDGGNPVAALTLGKDGYFYGSTIFYGSGARGTIFKITLAGALTTLYSFTGGSDGAYVAAPLVQGSDDNFYGISSLGGQGHGTIFRITPGGALTSLYQFPGPHTSGNEPYLANTGALVQASDGNFYSSVPQFDNSLLIPNDGAVFRITPIGTFTVLAPFVAIDGELPVSVTIGQDGNYYGGTARGGARNDGVLFRTTPQGRLTTLLDFNGFNGALPEGVVQGTDGDLYGTTAEGGPSRSTAFRTTSAGKVVWQVAFNGTNGASPLAGLLQASDGNFYGTTSRGGKFDNGTVFRVTPSGVLTTLYSFARGDGASPQAALVQDSHGNLYGTTSLGGASGNGTVFRITLSGSFTSLYSFTGGSDGGYPFEALTLGQDGNLYSVTFLGGSNFVGTLFQISPSGAFKSLYSFSPISGDGYYPYSALVRGLGGVFYGATISGGTGGAGTLYSVTTAGSVTTLYSFTNETDGNSPISLSPAPNGKLLGTTGDLLGDVGTIFEFSP
jgi:uncharacterized repeat protein (TIGR03803 family)